MNDFNLTKMLDWDEEVQDIFIVLLDLDSSINAMTEHLSEYFYLPLYDLSQESSNIFYISNLIKKKYNKNSLKRACSLISSRYGVSKFFLPSNLKGLYTYRKSDHTEFTYTYDQSDLTICLAIDQNLMGSTNVNRNRISDYQLSPFLKIFLNKNDRKNVPKIRIKQDLLYKEKVFINKNLFNSSRINIIDGSKYLQDIGTSDIHLLTTDLSLSEIFSANLLEKDLLKLKLNKNPLFYFLQTYNQGLFVYYSDHVAPKSLFENLNLISKLIENKKKIRLNINKQKKNLINSRTFSNSKDHDCIVLDFFLYHLENDKLIEDDNKSTLLSLLYAENYNCKKCCTMLIINSKLTKQNLEDIDQRLYLYAKNSFLFYMSKRFHILRKLTRFIDGR